MMGLLIWLRNIEAHQAAKDGNFNAVHRFGDWLQEHYSWLTLFVYDFIEQTRRMDPAPPEFEDFFSTRFAVKETGQVDRKGSVSTPQSFRV